MTRCMSEEQAERVANILIGVAAFAAAYFILRTPPLRRMAWQLARTAIVTTGPGWLMAEARRAWNESGSPPELAGSSSDSAARRRTI